MSRSTQRPFADFRSITNPHGLRFIEGEGEGTPPGTPPATPEPDGQGNPDEDALGDAGKKALDAMKAERNRAKRERDAFEAKLKEFEDRDKTEAQKATERLTAAEKAAAEATSSLARLEVALAKGLTPSQAKRLVGSTKEELEADADELLKDIGDAARPRAPKPDPTQGRTPGGAPLDPRSADLAQIEADLKAAQRR